MSAEAEILPSTPTETQLKMNCSLFVHTGQGSAPMPQFQGRHVVLRQRGRGGREAPVKVWSCRFGHFRGRREVSDRSRALRW